MDLNSRRQELAAIARLLEYARADAADLRPVPRGLLAALSVALEELRLEVGDDTTSAPTQ